jgi:LacI family transcriptional regulator
MLAGSTPVQGGAQVAVCVDKSRVYGAGVLQGLSDYMEVHGAWSVFLDPFANGTLPWQRLDRWAGQGILALLTSEHSARRAAQLKIPVVDLSGAIPEREPSKLGIPCVTSDHQEIGWLAAAHLQETGYAHFAYSGYANFFWVDDRWNGFSQAVGLQHCSRYEYTLPPAQIGESIRSLQRWAEAQGKLTEWIQQLPKPVAIMACNDGHALNLLDACRLGRIDVPDTVAIIGVDNDESLCRLVKPELSSVVPDPRRVGYEAARLLDELISGKRLKGDAPRILIGPRDVIGRLSTQGTAVADEIIAKALRSIREHAADGVNAEQILRQTGLSRRAFYQRFQSLVGRTPHEEISRVRLGRVKRLLQETSLSLEKVAELTGYCSAAHMSVAFRRESGMPPGEFRRRVARPM